MFDPLPTLALGLFSGIAFGFLLQRGQVAKFAVIVGQFLLRDFTMLKVMLSAIVVGAPGIYVAQQLGWAGPHVKPALLLGVTAGAVIFGIGMVVLGYCPGTGVAAATSGSRHARWGVLGMLLGAALYAETYPFFFDKVLPVGDLGKITLADMLGVPMWAAIVALILLGVAALAFIDRWERSHPSAVLPAGIPYLTGPPRARAS